MMKIAICSENACLASSYEVDIFCNAGDLVNSVYGGAEYDMICLDVGIDQCVELAENLLKADANTRITFIVGYKQSDSDRNIFHYYKCHKKHVIPIEDILYFESKGRNITIHSKDGSKQVFNDRLIHVEEQLIGQKLFCRVHQSYLVNTTYVSELDGDSMILEGGKKLPISRGRRSKVQSIVYDNWTE